MSRLSELRSRNLQICGEPGLRIALVLFASVALLFAQSEEELW